MIAAVWEVLPPAVDISPLCDANGVVVGGRRHRRSVSSHRCLVLSLWMACSMPSMASSMPSMAWVNTIDGMAQYHRWHRSMPSMAWSMTSMAWVDTIDGIGRCLRWLGSMPSMAWSMTSMAWADTINGMSRYHRWHGVMPSMAWVDAIDGIARGHPWVGSMPPMNWLRTVDGLALTIDANAWWVNLKTQSPQRHRGHRDASVFSVSLWSLTSATTISRPTHEKTTTRHSAVTTECV